MDLLKSFERSAEIDMKRRALNDQSGHRLDAGRFGFAEPRTVGAEMNDFDVETLAVKGAGDGLLGFDADRASSMIENGFGFHDFLLYSVGGCCVRAVARDPIVGAGTAD